jgi:hypothetical protein
MDDLPVKAAGRVIPNALDRIRRYCGLAWSGGPPETWAWHYYDEVPTEQDNNVTPVDVLCAAALHPGLSRADLTFFRNRRDDISAWLALVPNERRLCEISNGVEEHLANLPEHFQDISVSLLSKVLHRKRPHVIPLLDRHVVDWYRPVTGKRVMAEAWGPIVRAMRDAELDGEQRLLYSIAFVPLETELWPSSDVDYQRGLSWIRAIDIAICER